MRRWNGRRSWDRRRRGSRRRRRLRNRGRRLGRRRRWRHFKSRRLRVWRWRDACACRIAGNGNISRCAKRLNRVLGFRNDGLLARSIPNIRLRPREQAYHGDNYDKRRDRQKFQFSVARIIGKYSVALAAAPVIVSVLIAAFAYPPTATEGAFPRHFSARASVLIVTEPYFNISALQVC